MHGFGAVHAGYVASVVARLAGVPSVVSLRGNDVERAMFSGSRFPFLVWTLRHARALVGVSSEVPAGVRALTGRRHDLHRVPNGVDAGVFRSDAPPSDDLRALDGSPRPWIAFAGEARLKKGLSLLLDLAAGLEAAGQGTLVLTGGVRRDSRVFSEQWDPKSASGDKRVRLAANLAIDRQAINQAETLGLSRILGSIIPSNFEKYWPAPLYPHDPGKAKQLLPGPSKVTAGGGRFSEGAVHLVLKV